MAGAPLHTLESSSTTAKRLSRKWLLSFLVLLFTPFFFTFKTTQSYTSLPNSFEAFVGREEVLAQIKKAFFSQPTKLPIVTLWGERGIGKSETAIQFANLNLHKFSLVYWVNAGSEEIYQQSYYNLAQKFNIIHYAKLPFDKVRDKVHAFLENQKFNKPWLLIYDNADHSLPLPQSGQGKILITTRDKIAWEGNQCLEITPLNGKAADELYERVLGTKCDPEWQELAQELNYFPLALYQALHYVKYSPHFSIHDYLIIAKKSKKVLFKQSLSSSRYPHNLLAVWQMNASSMKAQYPHAYNLLQLCAHFHPDKIPISWVEKWLIAEGGCSEEAKNEAHELVTILANQGHIRLNYSTQSFSLHRIKQELIKQDVAEAEYYAEKALDFLAFLGKDFEYHDSLEWTGISYEELSNWETSCIWWITENRHRTSSIKKVVHLLNGIANIYAVHRRNFPKALETLADAVKLIEKFPDETYSHEMTNIYLNQGFYYLMKGEYDNGQVAYARALSVIQNDSLNKPTLELFRCYTSFLLLKNYRGDESALEWCHEALKIEKDVFGDIVNAERSELAKWAGELYRGLGEAEKAFQYTLQALKFNKQIFGTQANIQKVYLLSSLGLTCNLVKEYELGIQCMKGAYELSQFWPESYVSVLPLRFLVKLYLKNNQLKEAVKVASRFLCQFEETRRKNEHSENLGILQGIGELYLTIQQPKKALEYFQKLETQLSSNAYAGKRGFCILQRMGNAHCALGDFKQGIVFLERALQVQEKGYFVNNYLLSELLTDLATVYEKIDSEKAKMYRAKSEAAMPVLSTISEDLKKQIRDCLNEA